MTNARRLALTALNRMEADEAYSNLVLNSLLSRSELSREDKAFATRLFYGVVEKKITLDYNISLLSKRPISKLDVDILNILRLGMYQLLYLKNVPQSAAVNESVKLCAFTKKKSAEGFVNALLRNKIRQNAVISLPKEGEKNYKSVLFSADDSIITLLEEQYGEKETGYILESGYDKSGQFVRINTSKISPENFVSALLKEGIDVKLSGEIEGCAEILTPCAISNLKAFEQGLFYVQDLSSQRCCAALGAKNAKRILDACAAPGSKSFTLALTAGEKTQVLSCDVSENRVSLIKNGLKRLELKNVETRVQNAAEYNESLGKFDRILCDVPCSGLGVISKKPEIRYKKIKADDLFSLQLSILNNVSRYLETNGVLVYSTCTLNKRENEAVVEQFLKQDNRFEYLSKPKTYLPHKDGCDGFFVCAIKKIKD